MLTTFVTLLIAGFLYESCAAKCRKKRLTSKCSGFHQTTSQAYLLLIKRSSEADIQSRDNLWKPQLHQQWVHRRDFSSPFSLLDVPFALSFQGDLCGERFRGGFVLGFQSIRNLSSCNEDAGSQNVKKELVLCVKKQQLCTCITRFGTFFHFLTRRFTEDVNALRRIFFFLLLYFWR